MAIMKLNKFLCCIPLRIGITIVTLILLGWELKLIYTDVDSYVRFIKFYLEYVNKAIINMSFESKAFMFFYGPLHLALAVVDTILHILLLVGLFHKPMSTLIKAYYKGVTITVILNVVTFAYIFGVQSKGIMNSDKVAATLISSLAQLIVPAGADIYLIIAARSYYYHLKTYTTTV